MAAAALAFGAAAQENEDAAPPANEPQQAEPAPRESPDRPPDAGDVEDEIFIPTEEIPADEEITFPVNI